MVFLKQVDEFCKSDGQGERNNNVTSYIIPLLCRIYMLYSDVCIIGTSLIRSDASHISNNSNNIYIYIQRSVLIRSCSKTLYSILYLTQTCSNPTHISTPNAVSYPCCYYRCHHVLSGSQFCLRESAAKCQHCCSRASNPRPFGYEYYGITNWSIKPLMVMLIMLYCQISRAMFQ